MSKNISIRRLAFDFDGVIHQYSKGWFDGTIYDNPVSGAKECLLKLKENGFEIVINTARIVDISTFEILENKKLEVENWLDIHNIIYDFIFPKIPAHAYIDDRAIEFNANNINTWKYVESRIHYLKSLK